MTDNINPSYYTDAPFECIELSRMLSSDWGQVVQYCFRWQHKNGLEDLKKAVWFAKDAVTHGMPVYINPDWWDLCQPLFNTLANSDWAGLKDVWEAFTHSSPQHVLTVLIREVAEVEDPWIQPLPVMNDAQQEMVKDKDEQESK